MSTHDAGSRHVLRVLGLVLAATLIAAGCGTDAPEAESPEPEGETSPDPEEPAEAEPEEADADAPLDEVTVRFAWLLRAYDIGIVVALEKGFYEREGIDATVNEGQGDTVTGELVSNGTETFGTVDAATGADLISKGANLRYLAVILQTHPCSTIFYPESEIAEPDDLIGKQGGVNPAGACRVLLQAVLGKHGISEGDLDMTTLDPGVKQAALLERRVEWIHGFMTGDYLVVSQEDPDIVAVPYSEWDINALSIGLVTHTDTIEENPDLVQRFVRATLEGYQYAMDNKEEAADIGVSHFPESSREVLLAGMEVQEALLHTDNTAEMPLGWMHEDDWTQTIELMYEFGESDEPQSLDAYFTNEFVEGADG